jgi:hypothetical protein
MHYAIRLCKLPAPAPVSPSKSRKQHALPKFAALSHTSLHIIAGTRGTVVNAFTGSSYPNPPPARLSAYIKRALTWSTSGWQTNIGCALDQGTAACSKQ